MAKSTPSSFCSLVCSISVIYNISNLISDNGLCSHVGYCLYYTGNGLFTTKRLEQGEYVLAYTGLYLENEPPADTNDDYVYEVYHNKKKYW